MDCSTCSTVTPAPTADQLRRRAKTIIQARPGYGEMVTFYLPVFCRQVEWRDRVIAHPEQVDETDLRSTLSEGTPLAQRFDPGIAVQSMLDLWTEMKALFRAGNKVLAHAVEWIETAEASGAFLPAPWLLEQRPERSALVAEASYVIGIEETIMATLGRAVTLPHWSCVARAWVVNGLLKHWRRCACPVCGGPPGLVETRGDGSARDGVTAAVRRYHHCSFCGTRWAVPSMACPSCGSTRKGDARYLFTREEPELRIDYCASCHRYSKTVDGDKIPGPVHVGLEMLTTAHLDVMARDKDLQPLEIPNTD